MTLYEVDDDRLLLTSTTIGRGALPNDDPLVMQYTLVGKYIGAALFTFYIFIINEWLTSLSTE